MNILLVCGQIHRADNSVHSDILSKLEDAYLSGLVDLNAAKYYTFASPLLQQIWSWHLQPSPDYKLPYPDIISFVKAAVELFRPSHLTKEGCRVGAYNYRPSELQYQDEYYRCVHEVTKGNVRITPEYVAAFGTRAGRIDFFIPSKKWGIELTRDGSKLEEHASRFAEEGAYEKWLEGSDMLDYVLLDFRDTKPVQPYPGKKLIVTYQNIAD
jgi:hypothetical protein